MNTAISYVTAQWPVPSQRFAFGVALSIALHFVLLFGFGPTAYRYVEPAALSVEIRHLAVSEPLADIKAAEDNPGPAYMPTVNAAPSVPRSEASVSKSIKPVAPVEFPALEGDRYFTSPEVDVRAEQINEVDLVYPRRAYATRTSGRVVLILFINENGVVDKVQLVESTPAATFDEAALAAARALEFRPALRSGRHVKSQKTIEVVFDPYERINVP